MTEEHHVKDLGELVELGVASVVELEMKEYKTEPPSGVREGRPEPESHSHVAMLDEGGAGETKADNTGHQHKCRNWVALYAGVGPHIHKIPHGAPEAPAQESKEQSKFKTSANSNHSHEVEVDEKGNGKTTSDKTGHGHTVTNWVAVAGETGHSHMVMH